MIIFSQGRKNEKWWIKINSINSIEYKERMKGNETKVYIYLQVWMGIVYIVYLKDISTTNYYITYHYLYLHSFIRFY